MKYHRLEKQINKSAWRGTRWIFRTARKYGLHEISNACMHLSLCRQVHPHEAYLHDVATTAGRWFSTKTLAMLGSRAQLPFLNASTHLILLRHLETLGLTTKAQNNSPAVVASLRNFSRFVPTVRRLDTAADYWTLAYGLSLHGHHPDTRLLARLQSVLPLVSPDLKVNCYRAIDAFNFCTHKTLFETSHFHAVRPDLHSQRFARWMMEFWRKTDMKEDVEFLAEFLSCTGAIGLTLSRDDLASSLLHISQQQSASGCWQGIATTSRYERFHAAWLASEALHLGGRLL